MASEKGQKKHYIAGNLELSLSMYTDPFALTKKFTLEAG